MTESILKYCPLCRLPLRHLGGITTAKDDAGQVFSFTLCRACQQRGDRLPVIQRMRGYEVAISNIEKHPERYAITFFDSIEAATIFVALEVERLSGLWPR